MATGQVIPWTDPGGVRCCCLDSCFSNFNAPDPPISNNQWFEIPDVTYSLMLDEKISPSQIITKGTWTLNCSIDITDKDFAYHPSFYRVLNWKSANVSVELQRRKTIQSIAVSPCDCAFFNASIAVTRTKTEIWKSGVSGQVAGSVRNTFVSSENKQVGLGFALATVGNKRYINIRSIDASWPTYATGSLYQMPIFNSPEELFTSSQVYYFPLGNFATLDASRNPAVANLWSETQDLTYDFSIDVAGTEFEPTTKVYYAYFGATDTMANHELSGGITASLVFTNPAP